jgi:hypothetical protein
MSKATSDSKLTCRYTFLLRRHHKTVLDSINKICYRVASLFVLTISGGAICSGRDIFLLLYCKEEQEEEEQRV